MLRSGLHGGQGMPITLGLPLMEMQISANVAWSMYPGLSHGAYSALLAHGTEELRQRYPCRNWYRACGLAPCADRAAMRHRSRG